MRETKPRGWRFLGSVAVAVLLTSLALGSPARVAACVPEGGATVADIRDTAALIVVGHVTDLGLDGTFTIRLDQLLKGPPESDGEIP